MAALTPPNEFSQHLAKWVYQKTLSSVVLVTYDAIDIGKVKQHMEKMYPTETEPVRRKMAKKRREIAGQQRCATGFVVQEADHLLVLTCAHALDHVFNISCPITADQISGLFNAQILCNHAENDYRLGLQAQRQFLPAEVVQVDCKKDLLLLYVQLEELTQRCQEPHPAVPIADDFPEPLEKVVVVSWPPYRPQTKCVGLISHEGRGYTGVFPNNPYGYNMSLSEVGILADSGSSGAPMLNGNAKALGVLHGGSQSSFCYFTSLPDTRAALTKWGLISHDDQ